MIGKTNSQTASIGMWHAARVIATYYEFLMNTRLISIAMICVSIFSITVNNAYAMKGGGRFFKLGISCWEKKLNIKINQIMCFRSSGNVFGMNSTVFDGMASLGRYKVHGNGITVIGFIGSDWISRNYGNVCKWSFSDDNQVLNLEMMPDKLCDISGSWHKGKYSNDQYKILRD